MELQSVKAALNDAGTVSDDNVLTLPGFSIWDTVDIEQP
jgi:hypothetical protein